MRERLACRVVVCLVLAASAGFAAGRGGRGARGAPLPAAQARWSHAPFESGECGTCHQRNDAHNPGALLKSADALCFDCHDDISARASAFTHPAEREACTGCHSPHNATRQALLY
ncbi:MAG: cytochrome c3 family protein [Deltaproteobacteria bacterium]|nr:cytochrome c3 family protein [Deltaproteobacteria bacterium]